MLKVDTVRSRWSAADVLTPVWRGQVGDLRAFEVDVRLDRPDGVHRFRVATRRLRSNLSGLRSLLDATIVDGLQRGLRDAAAIVSGARDAEVVRRRVDLLLLDEPDSAGVARTRERLGRMLAGSSEESRETALDYFDSPAYDALTRSLDRFSDLPPWSPASREPAEEALTPLLRKEWSRFRKRGREALVAEPGASSDDELHDARKAAKRARYLSEALSPVFGRRAKHLAKAAERVQVVLGDYQDSVITRSLLERAAAGAAGESSDEETSALGRMVAREERTARELRAEFERRFAEADRTSLRRWMR
jgi:CHAD domain-containing protein